MKKITILIPAFLIAGFYSFAQPVLQRKEVLVKDKPVKMVSTPPAVIKTTLPATTVYDFSKVRICLEQQPSGNALPPRNTVAFRSVPKLNNDGSISQVAVSQQGLTSATDKMWSSGDVITVFVSTINSTERVRDRVRFYIKKWEQYANIRFDFVTNAGAAKVKVGFVKDGTSWSQVGRDVLFNPLGLNTVNFGWFDDATEEDEFSRTVLHEFGHVLGMVHEHQSPGSTLVWNKEKTYAYFKETNKWSKEDVDRNVFAKYSVSNTNFSTYDKLSIMHYDIPDDLVISGGGAPTNRMLSSTDVQYARLWYPYPPTPVNATGFLRTGDDCDEVEFKVEYNAVAADKVEFVLQLGQKNNKKVTWWKQVGIPLTGNNKSLLWVQNHSLIASENRTAASVQFPVTQLDINRGISFDKAKILGVHTPLAYTWNAMPAFSGGCRVTLIWIKDSCN